MQLKVAASYREFSELAPDWRRLISQCPNATLFQSYEWHDAWLSTFGEHSLFIAAVYEDQELVGIAPLIRRELKRSGITENQLEFAGCADYASDFCDFIVREDRPEIYAELFKAIERDDVWSTLKLTNLPEGSLTGRLATGQFRTRHFLLGREVCDAPRWIFGNREADSELLKKKSLKRRINYFNREGTLEFKDLRQWAEIEPYLDPFFAQHIARRAETPSPSLFLDPREKDLYRAIARKIPEEVLRFAVLEWNKTPIAFHFGFCFNRSFIWYKPSFDPSLSKHSPGEALLWHLFDQAIRENCSVFDFTVGGEDFKYRFSNSTPKVSEITVYRRRLSYTAETIRRGASRIKRMAKR